MEQKNEVESSAAWAACTVAGMTISDMTIARVAKKTKIDEQQNDFAYWQSQSYAARLKAIEEIRQEYIRWKYSVEPRLPRVYRIIKLP